MEELPSSVRAIRFGVFQVDLRSRELWKKGIRIKLQDQPFVILITLLAQPGEIVSREDLRRKLWPDDVFIDFDHSLGTAINKLREVLGDSADSPRFIETVPRRGYRFIAPIESVTSVSYFPDKSDKDLIKALAEHDGRVYADGEPLPRLGEPDPEFKGNRWIPLASQPTNKATPVNP